MFWAGKRLVSQSGKRLLRGCAARAHHAEAAEHNGDDDKELLPAPVAPRGRQEGAERLVTRHHRLSQALTCPLNLVHRNAERHRLLLPQQPRPA